MIEKNLTEFETHDEYIDFINSEKFIKPNVSYCDDNDEVHFIVDVTGVTLSPSYIEISRGETFKLNGRVLPTNATNQGLTWESSDESIATVDENGLVTGIGKGSATITVTTKDGGFTASSTVVCNINVTGVTLDKSEMNIEIIGDTEQLIATVLPIDADNKNVTWSSSDDTIATVDSNGLVTAISLGEAVITVTTEDGGYTATCDVNCGVRVTAITLDYNELYLRTGGTKTITATIYPENATNKNVTWESSRPSVASVDENGVVNGLSEGVAVITVTTEDGGYTAACEMNIVDYRKEYFTVIAKTEGCTFNFVPNGKTSDMYYSIDGGAWTSLPEGTDIPLAQNSRMRLKMKGDTTSRFGTGFISRSHGKFELCGNVMSLAYQDNFSGQTALNTTFYQFAHIGESQDCYITSIENLVMPAMTFSQTTPYNAMFYGQKYLTEVPKDLLPATELTQSSSDGMYGNMFYGCSSMTSAPDLPATTISNYCYRNMFEGCSSLVDAPKILPATAVTNYCYSNMFNGCSSLEIAPELPAPNPSASRCYQYMFSGCSNLKYIKCLLNVPVSSGNGPLYNWVQGVQSLSTSTFVKHPDIVWPDAEDRPGDGTWGKYLSGKPRDWQVVDADV